MENGLNNSSMSHAEVKLLQDQMTVIRGNPQFQDLLNYYSVQQDVAALEIGGGIGILSGLVAALSGAEVTSTDISDYDETRTIAGLEIILERNVALISETLYAARENIETASRRVKFETCDSLDLPFKNEAFDFAFSLNAFEHISHPSRALKEIFRVLRPGGKVFVQFSPIFTADDGSHLYSQGLLDIPWGALLHSPRDLIEQVARQGGASWRVEEILNSLNGCPPEYYRKMFACSEFDVQFLSEFSGFVLPNSRNSPEFLQARMLFSERDLGVLGFKALLHKPIR